jgi:hypothetical protein
MHKVKIGERELTSCLLELLQDETYQRLSEVPLCSKSVIECLEKFEER